MWVPIIILPKDFTFRSLLICASYRLKNISDDITKKIMMSFKTSI